MERRNMIKYITTTIIVLLFTIVAYAGSSTTTSTAKGSSSKGPIELTISPSTSIDMKTNQQIRILPTKNELTDANAALLYGKAINSLPDGIEQQIAEWRKLPPEKLPVIEVESFLTKLKPTLDFLNQAARCKQCNWPYVQPEQAGQQIPITNKYTQMGFILDIKAKLLIYQGRYDQAIDTLKTSLKMAHDMGEPSTFIQGQVGLTIATMNCARIEQSIQSGKGPNFYWALQDINLPLVDLSKTMKLEIDNLKKYNVLVRSQMQKTLESSHKVGRQQMNYIDRRIAALQCIEALRLYSGNHNNKFPEKLSDITDLKIPNDPVTKKPFSYKNTGSGATLELEGTEGADSRDVVKYVLKLKN
jgi:hypothetical protein